MTAELDKLDAGEEYDFYDPAVAERKNTARLKCERLNAIDPLDADAQREALLDLFGTVGKQVSVQPMFNCDHGKNIHVGEDFLANYNVTILDIAPVHIGSHVMLGPGTVISTVGHPLTPAGRRRHLAQGHPVTLGDDVWTGANVTILPGVTIGDNVVIAAGAVVTADVPSNSVVGGVPARVLREIEDDVEDR